MTDSINKHAFLAILLGVLWVALAVGTYFTVFAQRGLTTDFYPRWVGAREMLRGANPYQVEISMPVPIAGSSQQTVVHPNFRYPATLTYILLPFWLLTYPQAISLWSGLILLLLFSLPVLAFSILKWSIKPLSLAGIIVLSTFGYRHAMNTYFLGQFVPFILGALVIAWWAISEDHPWPAALALVGATIRPEGALTVAAILLDLLLTRRCKILAIWTGVIGVLFGLSLLQIGFWVPEFVAGMNTYREIRVWTYPPGLIGVDALTPVVVVGAVLWGIVLLWQMRSLPDRTRLGWSLSVVTIVYLLILPQSKSYTLLYGLIPLWVAIWANRRHWWNLLFAGGILLSPWLFLFAGANLERGIPLEQLFTPVLLGILITVNWYLWRQQNLDVHVTQAAGTT